MWIISYIKSKIITNHYTIHFDKSYLLQYNNSTKEDSIKRIEKYSCWSVLFIDGLEIEARIIHEGRGKFKIVEDRYKAKYVSKIVDASEVIGCILKHKDVNYFMRSKPTQFSCYGKHITKGSVTGCQLN